MRHFVCNRCGSCCRWEGCVKVGPDEIDRIAAFLDMPVDEFIDRHTRLSPDRKHLSLLEKEDGSCRWLAENDPPECLIDPVKPQQCRDFPEKWNFPGWQSECGGTFKEQ